MKVAQEIDVDGVTIIINPENKLEAKLPENTSGSVEIEEINANLWFTFDQGLVVHRNDTNTNHTLQKLGRIKGTDWLAIRANDVFGNVQPIPEYDRSYLLSWRLYGDADNGYVSYIMEDNNIVGVTTQITFTSPIPAGMSFDVNFKLEDNLIKTVTVVSEGQSEFTVTTGKTDFSFDASSLSPGGEVYIDNEQNNVVNRVMYSIQNGNIVWVSTLLRD